MKTIEEKILKALNGSGIKKLSSRDCVKVEGNSRQYLLWDNLIFWSNSENIYHFSGRGWSSLTTKSRLNQLLGSFFNAGIYQKNWSWFLSWNGNKYPIDAESIFYFKESKLYKKAAHDVEVLPL